jgi:hypothetical protein
MSKTLMLHIGYAKTATTFLQEGVFPRLSGIDYLGRKLATQNNDHFTNWTYEFAIDLNYDLSKVKDLVAHIDSDVVMISNEAVMRPFQFAERIKRLSAIADHFDQVYILLSIRSQADLIFSRYIHDLESRTFPEYDLDKALDYTGLKECIWPTCGDSLVNKLWRKSPFHGGSCLCNREKLKTLNIPYYDLERTSDELTKYFGDKVHYIVSERLRTDTRGEIDKLCNFLSVDPLTDSQLDNAINLKSNERRSKEIYVANRKKYSENGVLDSIKAHFAESNRNFSAKTNVDLSGLNYY